ncbi:hypothetical protein F5H01DRAFT_369162 [Linnemannia elongata]|nr:hypothetical protein F5H01DRAFT_369162 [Linnemannia elongata]
MISYENHAITSQDTSTDRTQQFVFGAGFHKPFTVSPPIPQQPDAQIVFDTNCSSPGLKISKQTLEELRMFNNKATTVSQRTANASKCIWILAQEAQRLRNHSERAGGAERQHLRALPMIKYESSPPSLALHSRLQEQVPLSLISSRDDVPEFLPRLSSSSPSSSEMFALQYSVCGFFPFESLKFLQNLYHLVDESQVQFNAFSRLDIVHYQGTCIDDESLQACLDALDSKDNVSGNY